MSQNRGSRVQGGWNRPKSQKGPVKQGQGQEAANPTSTCQYLQSSNVKTVDTVPQSKFISTSGNHILSHGSNGISNIVFHPDFIQDKEMQDNLFKSLNESICWEDREVIIKGNTYPQPRLVAWFGPLPYEYSGLKFKPSQGNWPSCVQYIHDCIKEETGFEFNSVLINLYRDGKDSMGWHSDNELSMGVHPIIASVSFGDMRRFEMRRRNVKLDSNNEGKAEVTVPLKSGSLLIMDGETQRDWEHRIPKEYHDRKARINLTFRTIHPI